MDIKEAAARLDGSEYREEGDRDLWRELREARLVAICGASDDLAELRGAVDDEMGTDVILFDRNGLMQNECDDDDCPYWKKLKGAAHVARVVPIWDDGQEVEGHSWPWRYDTTIPHATFKVMEDGDPYCLGIVISLDDLFARNTGDAV